LLELRAADLRFTADEAATYFNDAMGLALTPADVDALESRTEGWIAALQLAALSMQDRDDVGAFIANFTGDDRFVVDYLAEEVLERQPDDVRRFLLDTSVLARLSGPLCDAVTQRRGGKATLEALDRANLFLVALDDRRTWYRYHHLFADVLRARLADEHPELIPALHGRASDWFDAHGDADAAIEHALAGAHFERAAQLIELAAPRLRQARQETTLRRWLEALPDEIFGDRPVLSVALVGARMSTGESTDVEQLLDRAESAPEPIVFDTDEYACLPAQIAVQRAGLALLAGDLAGASAHAERDFALVEPTDHFRLGAASALTGLARWPQGDLEAAGLHYADAVRHFLAIGYLADALGCSITVADIQIAQGRLRDAMRTFEDGLRLVTEHPGLRGAADMHVGMSEVLLARGDLADAARHLATSGDFGDLNGLPQNAYRWRVAMAGLRQAEGDIDRALTLLDEAERVYNTDFSPSVRPIPALQARVHLARGDLDAADEWSRRRGLTVDDELTYVLEFEHITLARILVARQHPDALSFVDRLRAAADAGSRGGTLIELLVLLALVRHQRGDIAAARDAIADALRRAEPEGYLRVFTAEGAAMNALLDTVALDGTAHEHAQRVLRALRAAAPAIPTRQALVDELSARELDVLRLLRSELSGPDIARALNVSLNTMRTHTKNVYAKLGATNRREAVRRADDLGI
ncbi:MAG TPA: LuxR C-terminal-related transcriptional regulator, partial [Acidimicrobiia bacterium]|nr:LuxR C-terminal-related transcriptional regulator [Acidimicrobiia bacterium]